MKEALEKALIYAGSIASIVVPIVIFRKGLVRALKWLFRALTIHWTSIVFVLFVILIWKFESGFTVFPSFWLALLFTVITVSIWVLHRRLDYVKRRVSTLCDEIGRAQTHEGLLFHDAFGQHPHKNWQYHGQWELVPGGGLSVTQSEKGGISRVGHSWTDYSFKFTGVIVNNCIAWIVRAQDFSNYYMIQLGPGVVRSHLRYGGRWIKAPQGRHRHAIDERAHNIPSTELAKPLAIRTEVRGLEIRVYVNNHDVYYDESFFAMRFINHEFVLVPLGPGVTTVPAFTAGRVGFREAKTEQGKFTACRVQAL